jgi:hypothetical protein
VADAVVLVLSKFSGALAPSIAKPRAAFGRDAKACDATAALFTLVNRCGGVCVCVCHSVSVCLWVCGSVGLWGGCVAAWLCG